MSNSKMIYVDANVFVYSLIYEYTIEESKKADYYLTQIINGNIGGCTSTLSWDEIFYVVKRSIGINEAIEAGKKILEFPKLKFIDVSFYIISRAQNIVNEHNMKPRDAIHSACALEFCDGRIISNDSDFDNVNGMKRIF